MLGISEEISKVYLNSDEQQCIQAFLLEPSYHEAKARIPERLEGTCNWLLSHVKYKAWVASKAGCLLVTGDPGCGKSVLAKYLVDYELPNQDEEAIVCYYFFSAKIQNEIIEAMAGLLHQLLSAHPTSVRRRAIPVYQSHGSRLVKNLVVMAELLCEIATDLAPRKVIIVLDALDECDWRHLSSFFAALNVLERIPNIKLLLTTRPYHEIQVGYSSIALRPILAMDEDREAVDRDVKLVVKHRMDDLKSRGRISQELHEYLEAKFLAEEYCSHLWTYLMISGIEQGLKKTRRQMEIYLKSLPQSVMAAYENLLVRGTAENEEKEILKRILSMTLIAKRYLMISEVQIAIKVVSIAHHGTLDKLEIEPDDDFSARLRDWSGFFLQVVDGVVLFIHPTARDFLWSKDISVGTVPKSNPPPWGSSFEEKHSNAEMARICITYLSVCTRWKLDKNDHDSEILQSTFLDYAVREWDSHFELGSCHEDEDLCGAALALCDSRKFIWVNKRMGITSDFGLLLPSLLLPRKTLQVVSMLETNGLLAIVLQRRRPTKTDASKALVFAAYCGCQSNVKLLLDYGADTNRRVNDTTALEIATLVDRKNVIELLERHIEKSDGGKSLTGTSQSGTGDLTEDVD